MDTDAGAGGFPAPGEPGGRTSPIPVWQGYLTKIGLSSCFQEEAHQYFRFIEMREIQAPESEMDKCLMRRGTSRGWSGKDESTFVAEPWSESETIRGMHREERDGIGALTVARRANGREGDHGEGYRVAKSESRDWPNSGRATVTTGPDEEREWLRKLGSRRQCLAVRDMEEKDKEKISDICCQTLSYSLRLEPSWHAKNREEVVIETVRPTFVRRHVPGKNSAVFCV
ncbi:hypothetical protein C8R45DRAFT_934001 [Mycena sanguinolenta]|nr:hypothetical protein C8R45DRAFT_934001 [Mycena sanguinolenta]